MSRVNFRQSNICVFCIVIIALVVIVFVTTPQRRPTLIQTVSYFDIDLQDVKQNSINAILIEQDDGSVFVAFQLNNNSKTVQKFRGGRVSINNVLNAKTNAQETIRSVSDVFQSVKQSNKKGEDNTDKKALSTAQTHTILQQTASSQIVKPVSTKKLSAVKNISPNPTFSISLRDNPYRINNKNVCKGLQVSFIVIVHSATDHFMRRASLRETWANYNLFTKHNMRILFLLGLPLKDSTQVLIEHESSIHNDIVQGDFIDSYRNLTHKGVLGLRWVSEFCPQAKRVVKVDDDVFVNVFKLMDDFDGKFSNGTRQIMCPVRPKGTSEIQRNSGKWKVDKEEFFNQTHYPVTYCNGFFVILSADMISELYNAAFDTPFFWVDDVYLFGLLPDRIGNVTYVQLPNLNLNENAAIKCFNSTKPCNMLVANAHSDGVMDRMWLRLLEQYKDLAKKYSLKELF